MRRVSRLSSAITIAVTTTTLVGMMLFPAGAGASPQGGRPASTGLDATDRYIVVFVDGVDAFPAAIGLSFSQGIAVDHVYHNALQGFSGVIPAGRLDAVLADPRVASVTPDEVVSISNHCISPDHPKHNACDTTTTVPATTTTTSPTTTTTSPTTTTTSATTTTTTASGQTVPTGILRINGATSSALAGNGSGVVDVDVAIIDTGIDDTHPDLTVAGGVNCNSGPSFKYQDGHGHGTHVAGTVAAKDNDFGVVGVAPGARLWAVRVLNNGGSGFRSQVICGIDWVAGQPHIEVANMSLGGGGSDDGQSCAATTDAYKQAICGLVGAGVTLAVAAGNGSDDAANHVPAAYDMVITVSALADFDGTAGGLGEATCRSDEDDTFANFSNYGADVDIIAPGVCILSTWPGNAYYTISGTSMATPHVAGAAALYLAANSNATPAQVRTALIAAGNSGWITSTDPDSTHEPLLSVAAF